MDGELKYEKVNLELDGQQKLPDVTMKSVNMNCEYDDKENKFISRTSTFRVSDYANKKPEFELSFRSNQSYVTSITFEFKQVGGSAQLGKVPKDQLEKWIKEELKELLPEFTLIEEEPLTADQNYIIVWGHSQEALEKNFKTLNIT